MKFLVADAESYWADDYTLSKMTSEAYIRDPQFKDHGWGILPVGGDPVWLVGDTFADWVHSTDFSDTAIICHNTRFDGAILGWRYGVKPRLWIDTMGMYRALYPNLKSYALSSLGKHFKFGEKGTEYLNTKNKRTLSPAELQALGGYCATNPDSDCRITERLFTHAWGMFPAFERMVMDMTLRMFIEPVFRVDRPVLQEFLTAHILEKEKLLADCGVDRDQIMSSAKFAALLESFGVVPPMKPSPSDKTKQIFAFAKTDAAMDELADHEDPLVQLLVAARLGNKSTLLETRTRHVIEIGERGTLPIPLNYWGAKVTGRHSGGDKINPQNFSRGSILRNGLIAPPGMMIVVGDSSNIELRLVMALAGQWDQINKIKMYDAIPEAQRTTDLYCDFATDIYGYPVDKTMFNERFVGKQGMLSLQYMASDNRFHTMLRQKKHPIEMSEATRVVSIYRRKHHMVQKLWYYCEEEVLPRIARGETMMPVDVNGWFLTDGKGFALPGEIGVQYPDLKRTPRKFESGNEWSYDSGRGRIGIYGAKNVENLCQHAARQVVMYQGLLVQTRYRVVHSVHDELVCCVPEDEAEACAAFMLQCLSTAPKWARGLLPVTGEVGIGKSYGAAK